MSEEFEYEMPEKFFTVEEANRLIPRLRPLIKRAVKKRERLFAVQDEIKKARDNARHDGGSVFGAEYIILLSEFTAAVNKIEELGVLVKDFRIGLCDFPHLKDGRIIYLCWKMDEEKVRFWHEVDAGFSGRQPL